MSTRDFIESGDIAPMPLQSLPPEATIQHPIMSPASTRRVRFHDNPVSTVAVYLKRTHHWRIHKSTNEEGGDFFFYDFQDPHSDESSQSDSSESNTNSETDSESDSDSGSSSDVDHADTVDAAEASTHDEVEDRNAREVEVNKYVDEIVENAELEKSHKVEEVDVDEVGKAVIDDNVRIVIVDDTVAEKSHKVEEVDVDNVDKAMIKDDVSIVIADDTVAEKFHKVEGVDVDEVDKETCDRDTASGRRWCRGWKYAVGGGVAAAVVAASAYALYKWLK